MCRYNVSVAEVCVIAPPAPQTFNETDSPGNATKEPSPFLFKYFKKQTKTKRFSCFVCLLLLFTCCCFFFWFLLFFLFFFFFFFFLPYFVVGGGGGDDGGGVNYM